MRDDYYELELYKMCMYRMYICIYIYIYLFIYYVYVCAHMHACTQLQLQVYVYVTCMHALYMVVLEGKSLKNRRNAKKRSSCMVYGECEGGDGQNISNRERCVEKNRTNSSQEKSQTYQKMVLKGITLKRNENVEAMVRTSVIPCGEQQDALSDRKRF